MSAWWRKTAIRWTNEFEPDRQTNCARYWNPDLLGSLSSLLATSENTGSDTQEKCTVSYGSLILATTSVVRVLRERLDDALSSQGFHVCDIEAKVGVTVVVAIPEGPLLPIAILAVHVLNYDSPFAVLVPLEPTEGRERVRHMLLDAKPLLILCMEGRDSDRLQQVLNDIPTGEKPQFTSNGLYTPTQSTLVHFDELVLDAVESLTRRRIQECLNNCTPNESLLHLILKCQEHLSGCNGAEKPNSSAMDQNRISHIVFTSGTTGMPKGCISSIQSLRHYIQVKNEAHGISSESVVLLASALSFDPCLSDILATLEARATLVVAPRKSLMDNLGQVLRSTSVTHVLCTPTLWSMVNVQPVDLPSLQVVALGGEPIPKHVTRTWARTSASHESTMRLYSTYGVTEACVYQTFGEVFYQEDKAKGQNVGKPLRGMEVCVCNEDNQNSLEQVANGSIGEVVLSGAQLDKHSAYLNRDHLSREKFVANDDDKSHVSYRTGDRGLLDPITKDRYVLGRIHGQDGMVKVNGVRVELGEIEAALIDGEVVTACLAVAREVEEGSKTIHAFCILGEECRNEIGPGLQFEESSGGVLLTSGPLLTLLRAKCRERAKVMPTAFCLITRLPLSPTGKRDRQGLPPLVACTPSCLEGTPLKEYGKCGATVAQYVIDFLNLQPCQQSLLTTRASFGMLGGDSVAATRLTRSLYAHYHGVENSRFLGGAYGVLEGPFATVHLLRQKTMGDYVDWLDQHDLCTKGMEHDSKSNNGEKEKPVAKDSIDSPLESEGKNEKMPVAAKDGLVISTDDIDSWNLYEALLEATTSGQSKIAMALLDLGVDPNLGYHDGRLSRVSDRRERQKQFRSNPLHLACAKGDIQLVKKLLAKGCKFNTPDAIGSFPLHLAASSTYNGLSSQQEEDSRRCECVRLLLEEAGVPLTMKDGNKQTVLHCAARAGHAQVLQFVIRFWQESAEVPGYLEWRDRWSRTAVHWAVLNAKVNALQVLLDEGCNPNPLKPKSSRRTSAAMESPMEICNRLYEKDEVGNEMRRLLLKSMEQCKN